MREKLRLEIGFEIYFHAVSLGRRVRPCQSFRSGRSGLSVAAPLDNLVLARSGVKVECSTRIDGRPTVHDPTRGLAQNSLEPGGAP